MRLKKILYVILVILLFYTFFTNAKYISESIIKTSVFCSKTLIPSIFPFMVVSLFLVNYSVVINTNKTNISLRKSYFDICRIYTRAVILGSVSGFVTGAKCICKIYDNNKTSNHSFNHAIAVSSNAGVGFTVSCVGILIWESPLFGVLLYLLQIISALIIGRIFYGKCESEYVGYSETKNNYIKAFTDSVTSSASALLNICAFITIFSLVSDIIALYIPKKAADLMNIVFEFSKGVFKCSIYSSNILNGFLCGFSIGFGGLSAIFQIISVCTDYPFDKRKFFVYKLTHGSVLGVCAMFLVYILDAEPLKASILNTVTNKEADYTFLIPYSIIILLSIFSYNYTRHLKRR